MELSDRFVDLVTRAHAYLTARQAALRADFRLGSWPRWDWDQESGELVFSEGGVPRVRADFQFVGTVSGASGTWLWAWANPHLEPSLARDVGEVRAFGEAHGVAQLTTPKWPADATDGWEMTSIAAFVLQAEGAYRTPRDDGGHTYLVLRRVRWADAG
jgi:hypothetical protein